MKDGNIKFWYESQSVRWHERSVAGFRGRFLYVLHARRIERWKAGRKAVWTD
jgi:hypothetical protein